MFERIPEDNENRLHIIFFCGCNRFNEANNKFVFPNVRFRREDEQLHMHKSSIAVRGERGFVPLQKLLPHFAEMPVKVEFGNNYWYLNFVIGKGWVAGATQNRLNLRAVVDLAHVCRHIGHIVGRVALRHIYMKVVVLPVVNFYCRQMLSYALSVSPVGYTVPFLTLIPQAFQNFLG